MKLQQMRQRIHDRIYGDIVESWRGGKLDDRQFSRAYRFRAQRIVLPVFFVPFLPAAIADWMEHDISMVEHLSRLGVFALIFGVVWLFTAAVVDGNARFGVQDMLLRRVHNAAEGYQQQLEEGDRLFAEALLFGRYTRTARHWNRVLFIAVVLNGIVVLMVLWEPQQWPYLVFLGLILLWALIARFDKRPYLDFSPEGIWCRAWGKQRLPFHDFKAAYPRQNRIGEKGVVLVPCDPKALAQKLSWGGRQLLRTGENVPAHAGTLTIWTSKVGLDQNSILHSLRAALARWT